MMFNVLVIYNMLICLRLSILVVALDEDVRSVS